MRNLLKFDLNFDREIVAITITSTLLLMVDYYHTISGITVIDRVALYMIIPLGIIIFAERKHPRDYGFTFGDWKAGLALTGLVVVIGAPVLWLVSNGDASMQKYYGDQLNAGMPVLTFLDLIGWEFFFRGWILFGYARVFGDHALWLQAVPFALAHMGKPEFETLSTIFGGFLFGLVAWRTRSFVYPFLIHWFVASFTILVASGTFS
jgi:membrane protease YdiL (CAAX protease family)